MQLPSKSDPIFHLDRYTKVISILIKYGFSDFVANTSLHHLVPKSKKLVPVRDDQSVFAATRYERIRMACEELGTTYIKFGQILSNRPDIFPDELIKEFEKFQDDVKAMTWEEAESVLLEEYDKPLDVLFQKVDKEPLAAASISQVHRAWLPDGKAVVLKIQRPNLRKDIEADIAILKRLAQLAEEKIEEMKAFQLVEMIKTFERAIMRELKFTGELANIQRFQRNFAGHKDIYVPEVYPELSSMRILCMEYIDAIKVTDVDKLEAAGLDRPDLAVRGINLYHEMTFDHGFFHADPHAGNIFIFPDGRFCLIDFGMMGTVIESDKLLLGDLVLSMATRDVQKLKEVIIKFSSDPEKIKDVKQLEYDIIDFFEEYTSYGLDDFDGQDVMDGLNVMIFEYKFRIPPNMLLLMKAMMMIEGIGLFLDPNYNIIKNMEPFVRRLVARKYNPKRLYGEALDRIKNFDYLTHGLPDDVQSIMGKINHGEIKVQNEIKGLESTHDNLSAVANRVSVALILSSVIVGSSLVVHAQIPPQVYGISALGFGGYIIAGVFGLRYLWKLWKQRKQ